MTPVVNAHRGRRGRGTDEAANITVAAVNDSAGNATADWLEQLVASGVSEHTLRAYAQALRDFESFLEVLDEDPSDVSEGTISRYIRYSRGEEVSGHRRNTPLAASTVDARLAGLRSNYAYRVRRRLMKANPVRQLRRRSGRRQSTPWIPSQDEWQRFVGAFRGAPLRNRLMLVCAYDGALRRSTLVNLQRRDFDLKRGCIHVRNENTKGGSGATLVAMSPVTRKLYRSYLSRVQQTAEISFDTPIFRSESNRNRGGAITEDTWNKVVKEVAVRAGLPRFSPHTLRHLRLTHMAEANFKLADIARYAGHISLDSTRLYVHLSDLDLIRAIATSTHLMTHQTELASRL